jgi:phosphate/sulfate permease
VALTLILGWYVGIGVLAAIGTIAISSRQLSARGEQIFFGLVLAPVAGMYLAFTSYFAAKNALSSEALAALFFTALGLIGMRVPWVLAFGYFLHGGWDLLHELHAHAGFDVGGSAALTEIPLAYGAFCATYDACVGAYFLTKRDRWRVVRQPQYGSSSGPRPT